jgi:hypothetical protein
VALRTRAILETSIQVVVKNTGLITTERNVDGRAGAVLPIYDLSDGQAEVGERLVPVKEQLVALLFISKMIVQSKGSVDSH